MRLKRGAKQVEKLDVIKPRNSSSQLYSGFNLVLWGYIHHIQHGRVNEKITCVGAFDSDPYCVNQQINTFGTSHNCLPMTKFTGTREAYRA